MDFGSFPPTAFDARFDEVAEIGTGLDSVFTKRIFVVEMFVFLIELAWGVNPGM